MDKFGSASSAFKQARSLAEQGRSQITAQFDKVDKRFPVGSQGRTNSSSSIGGLATSGSASGTSSTPPPPPPTRTGGPPPPPGRARATSAASTSANAGTGAGAAVGGGGRGVFSGMDEREKQAFFGLLDEYFSSRPQFAAMFGGDAAPPPFSPTPAAAPPPPPAASRPPPPAARGIGHAIALYDYAGGQPEDLSFKENDRITVLEVVDDDWLKGELNGRVGIFPKSYTQMQA